jgi:hypothetical protein
MTNWRGGRTFGIDLLLISLAFFGTTSCAEEVAKDETYFSVSGDVSVSVDQATAQMVRIRDRTPALTITSAPASIKKLGGSHSVNLFFSDDFAPNTGTYPIAFSYRKHANTLGGSFIKPGGMFSHDTEGTAEFIEFGEQVRVRFEFKTYNKSEGTEGRQGVTVKGEAVCPWADIF